MDQMGRGSLMWVTDLMGYGSQNVTLVSSDKKMRGPDGRHNDIRFLTPFQDIAHPLAK